MAGHALLVGLCGVDSRMYGGWDGRSGCEGCELDVDNIARILSSLGYTMSELKTSQATASNVLNALKGAARTTGKDDIFVFYYSGHGGTQVDTNGDEADGTDETLVAYDRQIVDDELGDIWPLFQDGARIVMLSDSCNSGTNYRLAPPPSTRLPIRIRSIASGSRGATRNGAMRAQLLHYSGCRDLESSQGYLSGGAFTIALCRAWNNGSFQGDYPALHNAIVRELRSMSPQQSLYNQYGVVSAAFEQQRPFTISAPVGPIAQQPAQGGNGSQVGPVEDPWQKLQELIDSLKGLQRQQNLQVH